MAENEVTGTLQPAPESVEEKLALVATGVCVIGGVVIPDGGVGCVGGDKYRCINGGLQYIGKC